jgi:glycosyltransferase involved in cell wall biosynthesis
MSAPALEHPRSPHAARAPSRPRRICLVTEAAGGGVGRHFLDLAEGLTARDIEVVAIYAPGRCDASFRERQASIRGVRFVELPMRRAIHPLDAVDLRRLIAAIRAYGPFDLIHGHSSKGGALARLAARWLDLPAIYTPHAFVTLDPMLPRWKRSLYGRIERWLARHSAGVIAVSSDEGQHARELGIDPRMVHIVHNGVTSLNFPPREWAREQLGLSPDNFAVGFVGRLVAQKAPEVLIDAFAMLAQGNTKARLVVVGSGPLEPAVRRRIEERGITPRVIMAGDTIATPLMSAFDVFCLPSRYEGMPYVLLEALAAGLPIVASRVGGVATCLTDCVNGIIVGPRSAPCFAAALDRLAGDVGLRQQFSAASADRSLHFSADRMVDETIAVYEHALSRIAAPTLNYGRSTER